jgi:hypothetical protein
MTSWTLTILGIFGAVLAAGGVGAEPQGAETDVHALYQRLSPGVSVQAVEALAERAT